MKRFPVFVSLSFLLVLVSATALFSAPNPAQNAASSHDFHRYVIVNGDNTTGSWDSEDSSPNVHALRARYGDRFAWLREGGREYIITDAAVLAELDKAMEPQKRVNAMQADVNADQARVNALQAKVNAHQNEVNAAQHEMNRRQDIANRLQSAVSNGSSAAEIDKLQAELRDLRDKPELSQQSVNQMQAEGNSEQNGVNAEQARVNARQRPLNEEQHRVSAEFAVRVNQIFGDALEHGTAQPLK